jgi:hypothetical protein
VTISSKSGSSQTRSVRLEAIGNGQIRLALPPTLRVFYSISSQLAPTVDPAFKLDKAAGPLITGRWGPPGDSELTLNVDTGIAGRLVVRRAPPPS